MKYLLLSLLLGGCATNETQEIENRLKINFAANLKDSTATIEDFRLIRLDTATDRHRILTNIHYVKKVVDASIEVYKTQNEMAESAVQLAKLWAPLSKTLAESKRKEAEKILKDAVETKIQIDSSLSEWAALKEEMKACDSVTPIAYQAVYYYQLRKPDQSIVRDTGYTTLTLDKEIIASEDLAEDE